MGFFLNVGNNGFIRSLNSEIYVDKTMLIKECNKVFNTNNCFMCVTRPRRFGKTMTLSMLNAYYSKGCDSKELFKGLKIENDESYLKHLNKHNVIWIDMSELYTGLNDKNLFVNKLKKYIYLDLKDKYKELNLNFNLEDGMFLANTFKEINFKLNERFIFLIDEWDVIYREQENNTNLCDEYTEFLRNLFKSSSVSNCLDLVYMTGILPIKRYSTQSTLNMFQEYNMINPRGLESFIGFTEDEVKELCSKYNRNFNELKNWYDGYKLNGVDIYNPCSVIEAIISGRFNGYWTQTSATEAIVKYLKYKKGNLKKSLALLITGEKAKVDVTMFENDLTKIYNNDSALTVLIHLGYLAYDEDSKACYIPNYEISKEFERAIKIINWKEYKNPISNSEELYEETLKGNTSYINKTMDSVHQIFTTMFNKNSEAILQMVVHICYFNCIEHYFIQKEATTSTGRADLAFIPKDNTHIPMIIELKVDSTLDDALKQIKEKKYINLFEGYHGKVLYVAITYNSKTLVHDSKIEYVQI